MEDRRRGNGVVDIGLIERMPGENTPHETRREAHESIDKEKRNRQIIDCLSAYGPMTAKEIAVNLYDRGIIPSSERNMTAPRLSEMSDRGIVEPIGKKKCRFTGRTVAVYDLRE